MKWTRMKGTCSFIAGTMLATVMTFAAAADLSAGDPIRVTIRLGNEDGGHLFEPDHLVFEAGKLYALKIVNAGSVHYYFGSQGMADAVYTRKVVALDKSGQDTVQVYGPVRRFEVKAGNAMEWWFVPVRAGLFDDLRSTRTHSEAGMRGKIEIR